MSLQPVEPPCNVTMTDKNQVRVEFDHYGHHGFAACVDDRRAAWNHHRGRWSRCNNPVVLQENRCVVNRLCAVSIEHHSAHEGQARGGLCARACHAECQQ